MNGMQLYQRYVAASLRAQMQYPGSFLMMSSAQFVATFIEFIGIWALFNRFGNIEGWKLGEVAMFYGTVSITFSLADAISRGFDIFGTEFVKTGNFDRLLLRPRPTILQLLGHELRLTRIGRLLQGVVVLAIASRMIGLQWNAAAAVLLAVIIAGGVALFLGILVLQATLAFWSVESLEIANTLTYGGVEAASYPLDIYSRWFRDFLIFVVPIGCVAYFPVERLIGHPDKLGAPNWLLAISPFFGVIFLAVSMRIWRIGVSHYTSTGS